MVALIIALLEHDNHAQQIRKSLQDAGHDVAIVDCFSKAKLILEGRCIDATAAATCDLIISEVHLENGGSIFDFLKWVKAHPRLCAVPFVLLSLEPTDLAKYLSDGVQIAARLLGASKYISMIEFDAAVLHEELSELLQPQQTTQS